MFDDVDKAWDNWKDKFISIVDNHAPLRTIRVRNKPVPWINNTIKFQLYQRDMLKKIAKRTGKPDDWTNYKKARNKTNSDVITAKRRCYQNKLNEFKDDSK
ncbi:Hypothetical predicted protein, partial [Paramuricea clavata]